MAKQRSKNSQAFYREWEKHAKDWDRDKNFLSRLETLKLALYSSQQEVLNPEQHSRLKIFLYGVLEGSQQIETAALGERNVFTIIAGNALAILSSPKLPSGSDPAP